jgi:hypothetical protein
VASAQVSREYPPSPCRPFKCRDEPLFSFTAKRGVTYPWDVATVYRPYWQTKRDLRYARDVEERFGDGLDPDERVWVAFAAGTRPGWLPLLVIYIALGLVTLAAAGLHYDKWSHARFPHSEVASELLFMLPFWFVFFIVLLAAGRLRRPRLIALTDKRMLLFLPTLSVRKARRLTDALPRIDLEGKRRSRTRIVIQSRGGDRTTLRLPEKDANAIEAWLVPTPPVGSLRPIS